MTKSKKVNNIKIKVNQGTPKNKGDSPHIFVRKLREMRNGKHYIDKIYEGDVCNFLCPLLQY